MRWKPYVMPGFRESNTRCGGSLKSHATSEAIESPAQSRSPQNPATSEPKNPPHEIRMPIVRPGRRCAGDFHFLIGSGDARRQNSPKIGHPKARAVRGERPGSLCIRAHRLNRQGNQSGIISRRRSRTRIRSPRSRYRRFRTRRSSARFPRSQGPKTAR